MKFLIDNAGTIIISLLLLTGIILIIRNICRKAHRGQCIGCDSNNGCRSCQKIKR